MNQNGKDIAAHFSFLERKDPAYDASFFPELFDNKTSFNTVFMWL